MEATLLQGYSMLDVWPLLPEQMIGSQAKGLWRMK